MKNLVFTAGCFDGGLHEGHLKLLREAKAQGDYLVVGINYDGYVARKGPGRPVYKAEKRKEQLYNTGLVNEVCVFGDSPLDLVNLFQPAVIVVGDDYTEETTVGAREARAWGGRVHIVKKIPGVSTTALVEQLNKESK